MLDHALFDELFTAVLSVDCVHLYFPESFPATMLSQGPPGSDDSDLDDHVTLGALKKKRKIISDDEDE